MDLLEIANKRATPGILVLDQFKRPVFLGPGVAHDLQKLGGGGSPLSKKPAKIVIPKEISGLFDRLEESLLLGRSDPATDGDCQTVFIPGEESVYCCRGFFLRGKETAPQSTFHMMVLIEKFSERYDFYLDKFRQQFGLSGRQMEIVKLLLKGAGNKEIGEKLCISEDTVKSHLKHVMGRLGVNSRVGILSLICKIIDGPRRSS